MACLLCKQNKSLIKKSHIISDFMYNEIYDQDHKIYMIDKEDFFKSKKVFSSEYEESILCLDCDGVLLSGLEDYARKILFGGTLPRDENIFFENRKNHHGLITTFISGLDYSKFKLFLLSILWRSSISSRKFFKQIDLGPHEEIIRKMILTQNAGNEKQYPCFISTYHNLKNELSVDLVGQPVRVKNSDGTRYVFLIGGLLYIFFISDHKVPDWIFDLVVNKKGEMSIAHMNREMGADMLNYFMGRKLFK